MSLEAFNFKKWIDELTMPGLEEILSVEPRGDGSKHKECGSQLKIYEYFYPTIIQGDVSFRRAYASYRWASCDECKMIVWKEVVGYNNGVFPIGKAEGHLFDYKHPTNVYVREIKL